MIKSKLVKINEVIKQYLKYFVFNNEMPVSFRENTCKAFPILALKENVFDLELVQSIKEGKIWIFGKLYYFDGITWDYDYEHRFDYKKRFYKLYRLSSYDGKKDPKYVMELSRLNHIIYIWLYGKTGNNEEDVEWAYEELNKWIKYNPVGRGMGWACTMDVALRAINLVVMYSNDDRIERKQLIESIWGHHYFIKDNLENRGRVNNNHYLTDLTGLIFTSIALGDNTSYSFANEELMKELDKQVLSDGVGFEGSTTYHRFDLQLLLYLAIFLSVNKFVVPIKLVEKISKMASFIVSIESGSCIPVFGDCDSSFVLSMDDYEGYNIRYIGNLLKLYRSNIKNIGFFPIKELSSFNFSGYYILSNSSWKSVIKCGCIRGTGGHYHNDQLSYVLFLFGEEIFVDRGLYSYYGNVQVRNDCRSTKSHNCYHLDGIEQNSMNDNELFLLDDTYSGEIIDTSEVSFAGKFLGYNNQCTFVRKCYLNNDCFKEITSYTLLGGEINYYLAPGLLATTISANCIRVKGRSFSIRIECTEEMTITEDICYTAYMKSEQCNVIRLCPQAHEYELKIYEE